MVMRKVGYIIIFLMGFLVMFLLGSCLIDDVVEFFLEEGVLVCFEIKWDGVMSCVLGDVVFFVNRILILLFWKMDEVLFNDVVNFVLEYSVV